MYSIMRPYIAYVILLFPAELATNITFHIFGENSCTLILRIANSAENIIKEVLHNCSTPFLIFANFVNRSMQSLNALNIYQ